MPWSRPETSKQLSGDFLSSGSCTLRNKMMRNWGVIGGLAAAMAAGVYVLWGPITDRKKRRRGLVPGLLNLGNTCFLNSLLQGLAACPSFLPWLEEASRGRRGTQLSSTLAQLLRALSSDGPGDEEVLDAGCLLDALRLHSWHISSFEEQDAHELFHVITSSLEEERDQQHRVAPLFDMQSLQRPPEAEESLRCRTRGPLHPIPSPWKFQHPFHGRLTSYMACKRCEQQSPVRYDSFDSLSLSIPSPQWGRPVSLDLCLQHFISSETIQEVECENCTKLHHGAVLNGRVPESQRTTFIKQLKLGKLPQCLCIHLQRLTWSNQGSPLKRQEHVRFSEFLTLGRYTHRSALRSLRARSRAPRTPTTEAPRTPTPTPTAEAPEGAKDTTNTTTNTEAPRTPTAGPLEGAEDKTNTPPTTEAPERVENLTYTTPTAETLKGAEDRTTTLTTEAPEEAEEKTTTPTTDVEHLNNNKPLSNGSCPSALLPPAGLTYDYSSSDQLFQLMAVVCHHGDMHSGHFVTYRRCPASPRSPSPLGSQWLWASDDSVRKASLQEALSSNAYLLFYERVRGLRPARRSEL